MDYISGWCKSHNKMEGLTAIVTGCNSGIGKETAADFYARGARVIMACRNVTKAEKAKKEIEKETNGTGSLIVEKLDLSSMKSIREFSFRILASETGINILVNNAGVMMYPQDKTEDGFEVHIGSNHFGHAMLTLLLLPRLIKSGPSRIIFVSSYLHYRYDLDLEDLNFQNTSYSPYEAYCRSKSANILYAKALALKLKENNINSVNTYSLHPGVIVTGISRHFDVSVMKGATWVFNNILGWFVKSPRCGAQTTIYCSIDDACANESGLYYSDCATKKPSKQCQDDTVALKLWELTMESLKINTSKYNPFGKLDPKEELLGNQ